MTKRKKLIFIAPAAIAGMVLFAALGGWIVQSLWNWLMPSLFTLRSITFWQALGLLVLCRILFGRFGGPWRPGRREGRRRILERIDEMSPEERERFRQRMRERWGAEEEREPTA